MKRATPILIVLALCAGVQAFTGEIHATVRTHHKDGTLSRKDVVVYADGERWRMETTWMGKTACGDGKILPTAWVETMVDGVYTCNAEELNVCTIHGGQKSPFKGTIPDALRLYKPGQLEAEETRGAETVYVQYTKVTETVPQPAAFNIQAVIGTRTIYYNYVAGPDGRQCQSHSDARDKKANGLTCIKQFDTYFEDCGAGCTGYFAILWEFWGCSDEGNPEDNCFMDVYNLRLSEIACTTNPPYSNCQPIGDWYHQYAPMCQ